jgi:hypothetical protein
MEKLFATYQNGQDTFVFNLPDIVGDDGARRQPSVEEYRQEAQKIGIAELVFKTASELDILLKTDRHKALRQIAKIESQITPRRLRDAILGDNGWLQAKEAEIQAVREELTALT